MANLSVAERRRKVGVIAMFVLSLAALLEFAILAKSKTPVTFGFVMDKEWVLFHQWVINAKTGSLILSLIALAGAVLAAIQFRARKTIRLASGITGFGLVMSFLCWAASGKFIPFTGLLQGALLLSVPLIFGSMAGVLSERSGVINIAIEGQLLAGAFAITQ